MPKPKAAAADLEARFEEAGTTSTRDPATGHVLVANWPKPRWTGSPTFLSDALEEVERELAAERGHAPDGPA